ncbi:MAG: spermidine/putrescine transport system permease protein [Thermoleophilaceae bacterium]|jgi:spermidine/putrescine transport system permease protein|nr:spermidine/putrescine transport system permease protein [Thermoleophilaceae bacterium]
MLSTRSSARRRAAEYGGLIPAAVLLGGFFGFALVLTVLYSFWKVVDFEVVPDWTLDNYRYFFTVGTYVRTFVATLAMVGVATSLTLAVAVPFAYWLTRYVSRRWRRRLLIVVVLPFFASYLLRVYAWLGILGQNGAINRFLQSVGLTDKPVSILLFNRPAVVLVLVYLYFPFAVLALYVALEQFDWRQLTAAMDLGATGFSAARRVLLPQIRPGIVTAVIFVSIPMLGEYVTPLLVGGTKGVMVGNLVANFFDTGEYSRGAAAALLIAAFVVAILIVFRRSLDLAVPDDA